MPRPVRPTVSSSGMQKRLRGQGARRSLTNLVDRRPNAPSAGHPSCGRLPGPKIRSRSTWVSFSRGVSQSANGPASRWRSSPTRGRRVVWSSTASSQPVRQTDIAAYLDPEAGTSSPWMSCWKEPSRHSRQHLGGGPRLTQRSMLRRRRLNEVGSRINRDEEMTGRGAVVTGSGSGIGRSIALTLADAGLHVVDR